MRALISCRLANWHWGNIIIVEMSDKILLRGRLHVPIGKGLGDGNSSNLTVLFINFLNCLRTIFSNMLHQFFFYSKLHFFCKIIIIIIGRLQSRRLRASSSHNDPVPIQTACPGQSCCLCLPKGVECIWETGFVAFLVFSSLPMWCKISTSRSTEYCLEISKWPKPGAHQINVPLRHLNTRFIVVRQLQVHQTETLIFSKKNSHFDNIFFAKQEVHQYAQAQKTFSIAYVRFIRTLKT